MVTLRRKESYSKQYARAITQWLSLKLQLSKRCSLVWLPEMKNSGNSLWGLHSAISKSSSNSNKGKNPLSTVWLMLKQTQLLFFQLKHMKMSLNSQPNTVHGLTNQQQASMHLFLHLFLHQLLFPWRPQSPILNKPLKMRREELSSRQLMNSSSSNSIWSLWKGMKTTHCSSTLPAITMMLLGVEERVRRPGIIRTCNWNRLIEGLNNQVVIMRILCLLLKDITCQSMKKMIIQILMKKKSAARLKDFLTKTFTS